jgi:Zn-dependent protease with chaperone function/TPR repeat protein
VSILKADYFDGKSSRKHPVTMLIAKGRMKVVGRDVALDLDAQRVRRSLRVADTPRWFYLPGGGACVTADNEEVDRITLTRGYERTLHRWETHPAYAALAVLLVVVTAWLLLDFGLPAAAEQIAEFIPVETEAELGRQTLQGLDQQLMRTSQLPEARQAALRAKFNRIVREANEVTSYQLEFRASPVIGPNAFALPSGIIIVTDELVKMAKRDDEILGVLAHELGHVRHRHSMRRLLEGSATALVIAGITGDVSSAAALASSAPLLLLHTKYSRANEREADAFAIALMQKTKLDPRHLGAILTRMEEKAGGGPGIPTFLSSHPETKERKAMAQANAQAAGEPEAPAPPEQRVEPRRLALRGLVQLELADLLQKKDFEGLERVLGGLQAAFEKEPSGAAALEGAYWTFGQLPDSAGAALDEWVQRGPASYAALTARGRFLLSRAMEARGQQYARDTPEENFKAMRAYLDRARTDFEASLPLTARPYESRAAMLMMVAHFGDARQKREWYEAAMKLAPQDAYLRILHMSNIEPRWGGSLKEMDAFAAEARAELKNPRDADRVSARPQAYRGLERAWASDWSGALPLYEESIKLYEDAGVLCDRSHALSMLKRHDEAFADAKRALETGRPTRYCLDRAVSASGSVKRPKEVLDAMNLVLKSEPALATALNMRAYAYQETGNLELAFQDLLASAKLGDGWAQMQVGIWYQEGTGVKRDYDESLAWLAKAVEQDVPYARKRMDMVKKEAGKP